MDSQPIFTNDFGQFLAAKSHKYKTMLLTTDTYLLRNDKVLSPYFSRKAIARNYTTGDR